MSVSDETERSRVTARLEFSPLVWLICFELVTIAVAIGLLFLVAPNRIELPFLILFAGSYFIYGWIALYAVVEFTLWRRMRNLGHLLQFLGSLLVVVPLAWVLVPPLTGLPTLIGVFPGVILYAIMQASFPAGLVLALYGYYHREYHASDVDLYRNVVVRAGERIGLLTDGYSPRTYETRYDAFPGARVRSVADEYALKFRKAGFYLWHRTDEAGITLYPVTYTGVGGLRLGTALGHLYRLWRRPDRLTWIRVEWSGSVRVHISPEDYRRIRRPVAHHILCAGVADAVVGSLLAFANGHEQAAVVSLLGPDRSYGPKDLQLPSSRQDREAIFAIALTAILLVAGSVALITSVVLAADPISISNVHWAPSAPKPGESVDVYATIVDYGSKIQLGRNPKVHFWAYFNDTTNGTASLVNVGANDYRTSLGPFSEGTEVTFLVAVELQATLSAWLAQSPAYVLDIGNVKRGGSSGLVIEGITVPKSSNPHAPVSAWINASAPITEARLLVTGVFGYATTNGGGGGSWGVMEMELVRTGSLYTVDSFLTAMIPREFVHMRGTLDLKFITKDATGNTATSEFIVVQLQA
jgi:hypothetical protein